MNIQHFRYKRILKWVEKICNATKIRKHAIWFGFIYKNDIKKFTDYSLNINYRKDCNIIPFKVSVIQYCISALVKKFDFF